MNVLIRVDASVDIGTGHLMRCLTLANALRARGSHVEFVCREHEGHLCERVAAERFSVCRLPAPPRAPSGIALDDYAAWLGVSQEVDAEQTRACRPDDAPRADWLVVDHYGLDTAWETRVGGLAKHLLVIDDMANRRHICDLLLDQNLNRSPEQRYRPLVPAGCRLLLGPRYALLREEFSIAAQQLGSRSGNVARVLVFFGGTDPSGETMKTCRALGAVVPDAVSVDVVVGAANPDRQEIERFCNADPRFRYHLQISNMAELIRDADLAIGAGGTTTWERTFLGLPAVTIAVAENQVSGTEALAAEGAIVYLGTADAVTEKRIAVSVRDMLSRPETLRVMGQRCLDVHGSERTPGVERVIRAMEELSRADA